MSDLDLHYCPPCRRAVLSENWENHEASDIHAYWLGRRGADYTDTIARHMALGAAVERLENEGTWQIERDFGGWYIVSIDETNGWGRATDLDAAIDAALRDPKEAKRA